MKIKKHSFCLTPPFLCSDWVSTMKPRVRVENITKTVARQLCCPGYRQTEERRCEPECPQGCGHGECVEPGVCQCEVGYSGGGCERLGCEGGGWGLDCQEVCTCQHGAWCHPVTGDCSCTPGYQGDSCQLSCPPGTWGEACSNSCHCDPGFSCHHVTGDCSPCPQGTFGELCSRSCECEEEGTQLCSHLDGHCYCRGNWFGTNCHLHCPFGLLNGTCLTSPPESGECQCPNDLYSCHSLLGCVCPPGMDCGIETIDSTVSLSPYSDPDTTSSNNTAAITFSVLIIALAAVVLVILYYRRRLGVMKKDLQNRSVYYCDREQTDQDRTYDLIVRDQDPFNNSGDQNNTANIPVSVASNNLLNNVVLSLESQRFPNTAESNLMKKVNNVASEEDGASGYDVNLCADEKSNLNRFYPKVMKADLEVMIRNNLAPKTDVQDDEDDADSVHKLKVNFSKNSCS